jgi:acetylornithine deacetylase/succinyl-diaminopimelate desuccinylase-like protein
MQLVRVVPTTGHPLVYASWKAASALPTILVYGHYDVVRETPLNKWKSPPFIPTLRGMDLHGRGSSDDKGQLFCHIKAIESYLQTVHCLPVNVKCVFEGEEEIGSTHLLPFIERNRRALHADAALISDTRMLAPDRPAISYAQRGGLRAEIEVRGPKQELHSGAFGGAVLNPIQVISEIIASLHDEHNRITIPGFYEDVRVWSEQERSYMERSGPSDAKILQHAGTKHAWGESGYSVYERTTIRPALTFNGIDGGHHGPGVKGVIPTHAIAKLSFRLVPDQDPDRIARLFREHVARVTSACVDVSVKTSSPIHPALVDRNHPALQAAAIAYRKGFGAEPVFLRSGGSIPVVNAFEEHLGIPAVLMGFGLPDDRPHAPNEKFHIPNFYRGIATSIWYLATVKQVLNAATAQAANSKRRKESTA